MRLYETGEANLGKQNTMSYKIGENYNSYSFLSFIKSMDDEPV